MSVTPHLWSWPTFTVLLDISTSLGGGCVAIPENALRHSGLGNLKAAISPLNETLVLRDAPILFQSLFAYAARGCAARFAKWHGGMVQRGVYWPPAQFEAAFVSAAHTEALIDETVQAAEQSL